MKKVGFSSELGISSRSPKSFRGGMIRGSERLITLGHTLKSGVVKAVFPEDLKVHEKRIFDPQDKFLLLWNRLFVISCIVAVSIDPLFFYLPIINLNSYCVGMDNDLAYTATTLRTSIDAFYLIRMYFQFRTAYISPSSRVFGRGELVIDPTQIAHRYLQKYFLVDLLAVLPFPQTVVWKYLRKTKGSDVLSTKRALLYIINIQYIPRFYRFIPLTNQLKKTVGVFAESAFVGAAYYLLWFLLCSHMAGAFWYLLAVERIENCWKGTCRRNPAKCMTEYLYCGNMHMRGFDAWSKISGDVLMKHCSPLGDNPEFDFGMYKQALSSRIVNSRYFLSKFLYCLWWGLQSLSTYGQTIETSVYIGEVIFSIIIALAGLVLTALLIGKMQTNLESLNTRVEEMRLKRRDSEQWMHHRLLPEDLRERVRRYDQYKWLQTRGVDEEELLQSLPKDLRKDIKRHLCLALVKRVPIFENMDERLLDAICDGLKPSLFTVNTYIVREGDPVVEMLFIIRGRLESVTTDGGRSGFYNRSLLKEGDFCGEELLTWALDPKSEAFPGSTRTVKALTEVEAFALIADELQYIATQFRRLHSRQVQHTFRFHSQQWRTWGAVFIQAAWRRHCKRKAMEHRRIEGEEFSEAW